MLFRQWAQVAAVSDVSMSASAAVSEGASPREPAAAWGVHYPLMDHALKKVSPVSVLLLTAAPIVLVGRCFPGAPSSPI